jgi:hypothetical protein
MFFFFFFINNKKLIQIIGRIRQQNVQEQPKENDQKRSNRWANTNANNSTDATYRSHANLSLSNVTNTTNNNNNNKSPTTPIQTNNNNSSRRGGRWEQPKTVTITPQTSTQTPPQQTSPPTSTNSISNSTLGKRIFLYF